jgi:hypothetical protein
MEERKELICTPYIVEDVCGLIRKPNGKVEAGTGNHDDNIMSYLMGLFIYFNAPYEKLAEYGIRRGESDNYNSNDYDEKGNITQEGTLNKLKEMLPSLPDSFKEVIMEALNKKDPITDAINYAKEIKETRQLFAIENGSEIESDNMLEITQTNYPDDVAFWNNFDDNIWNLTKN